MDKVAYPPDDHFLTDLGIVTERTADGRSFSAVSLTPTAVDSAGRPAIGLLCPLMDVNAAQVAIVASRPRWTATSTLEVHLSDAPSTGSLLTASTLVRVGSNLVVVRTSVYDGNGASPDDLLDRVVAAGDQDGFTLVASGLFTFAKIPGEASLVAETFDSNPVRRSRLGGDGSRAPRSGTPAERVGVRVVAPGMVETDPSPYVSNSFGTVTGGVYGVLFEAAAESLEPNGSATDVSVHFLRQTAEGPILTVAEVVRSSRGSRVCDVSARVGDKVLAVGTAIVDITEQRTTEQRATEQRATDQRAT